MITRKNSLLLLLSSLLTSGAISPQKFPEAQIGNDSVHARLYLPDVTNGYYRACRFDWAGIIPDLEYKGHSYFGQWFDGYDPERHDAIMGPVEAFNPIGYEAAHTGEGFVKIGIGVLEKPVEEKYSFATRYKILNPGSWKVTTHTDRVEFQHILRDKTISYDYRKTVQVTKGKPELVITHTLKNEGAQAIETEAFNHNFFMLDKQTTGPASVIRFPFTLSLPAQVPGDLAAIEGKEIIFKKEIPKKNSVMLYDLRGFDTAAARDYDIRIENHHTGAGVRITCDRPISRLAFWAIPATLCPEPYIRIKVAPGQAMSWTIRYEFYTVP